MTQLTSHLKLLEAESIHIFREAAAQFRAPVLLYSIGKDSTVLLHLARKAFWPAKIPFPLQNTSGSRNMYLASRFRSQFPPILMSAPNCPVTPHVSSTLAEETTGARPDPTSVPTNIA